MRFLITLDVWLARVEGVLLAASLLAMLGLSLYSVAYRNLAAPTVLWLQGRAHEEAAARAARSPDEPRGGGAVAGEKTNPGAAEPSRQGGDDGSGGGAGDDDDSYLGDLAGGDDDGSGGGSGDDDDSYLGDLAGGGEPSAPAGAPQQPAPVFVQVEDTWLIGALKALNFAWIDVFTRHLLLWVAFLGAALATRKRKHINIDALSRVFSDKARARLRILLDLVAALVAALLASAAWKFMMSDVQAGGTLYKWIPSWVGIGIIPVGFGLLALHFGLEVVFGLARETASPDLVALLDSRIGGPTDQSRADQGEVIR